MEEWIVIEGFPGYKISNHGRVWSNKLMRCLEIPESNSKDGYLRIGLWINNERWTHGVHRLVATHFIPNPEMKYSVNHIDGNIRNNHVSNLEWATHQEQEDHKRNILGYNGTKGIHTKPVMLEKDGVEYRFEQSRDAFKFLKCSGQSWKRLRAGENIKGYKIKNISYM